MLRAVRFNLFMLALFALAACAGNYNPDADRGLSALQQRIDRHIVALISYGENKTTIHRMSDKAQTLPGWVAGPTYADSESHYGDVDSAFASLNLQYQAMDTAGIKQQIEALNSIRQITRLMADEHKRANVLPVDYLTITRMQLLGAFSPLLTYQRVLRPAN